MVFLSKVEGRLFLSKIYEDLDEKYTPLSSFEYKCIVKDGRLNIIHPWSLAEFHKKPEKHWDENNIKKAKLSKKRLYMVIQQLSKNGELSRDILYDLNELKTGTSNFDLVAQEPLENTTSFFFYNMLRYQFLRFDIH